MGNQTMRMTNYHGSFVDSQVNSSLHLPPSSRGQALNPINQHQFRDMASQFETLKSFDQFRGTFYQQNSLNPYSKIQAPLKAEVNQESYKPQFERGPPSNYQSTSTNFNSQRNSQKNPAPLFSTSLYGKQSFFQQTGSGFHSNFTGEGMSLEEKRIEACKVLYRKHEGLLTNQFFLKAIKGHPDLVFSLLEDENLVEVYFQEEAKEKERIAKEILRKEEERERKRLAKEHKQKEEERRIREAEERAERERQELIQRRLQEEEAERIKKEKKREKKRLAEENRQKEEERRRKETEERIDRERQEEIKRKEEIQREEREARQKKELEEKRWREEKEKRDKDTELKRLQDEQLWREAHEKMIKEADEKRKEEERRWQEEQRKKIQEEEERQLALQKGYQYVMERDKQIENQERELERIRIRDLAKNKQKEEYVELVKLYGDKVLPQKIEEILSEVNWNRLQAETRIKDLLPKFMQITFSNLFTIFINKYL